MATAVLPATWPSRLAWLWEFLCDELAPYPGRGALVSRMVISATIVMMVTMIFQIPYGAYAAIYALIISRENTDATLKDVQTSILGFAIAAAYILIGATFFGGEPVLRLVWVLITFFLMFWALSSFASYVLAVRFGYLIVVTIPLWDRIIPAEQKVVGTLWAIGSLSFANVIIAAVELIFMRFYTLDNITSSLVERLECAAALLHSWSAGVTDHAREQQLTRLSILGTSRMRRDLLRSGYSPDLTQQMGAVISLVGRLVDTSANLTHFRIQISQADLPRLNQLANKIEVLADHLLRGTASEKLDLSAEENVGTTVPLFLEMERTVSLVGEALSGSEFLERHQPPAQIVESRKTLFVPDAFSNPKHVQFGIRGGLAASACYLTYNFIAWPGISTAVTTCLLTALTTVGASRQRQVLRFSGAVVGGVILGFGAQMFVLSGLESISGFLMLFLAVTIPCAWIAAAGPRLSYFGVQIAQAFYLINLQEFKFQTSLAVARDRVVGVLVGLVAMWLIFDQLWRSSALADMEHSFISSLKALSKLLREPLSSDVHAAIERSYSLRESISANFDRLRRDADGVMLEFGRFREQKLALRARLLHWQLQLRIIFITQIALQKYRFRIPGFELPEPILKAQQLFESRLADRLEAIAGRLQGSDSTGSGRRPEKIDFFLPLLQKTVQDCCQEEPSDSLAARKDSFLHLAQRMESLLRSLEQEILTMFPPT